MKEFSIDTLEIPKHLKTYLRKNDINTISQLRALSMEQLLKLKGIGKIAAGEIIAALGQYEKTDTGGIIEKKIVLHYVDERTTHQKVAGIAFYTDHYAKDIPIEHIGLESRLVAALIKAGIYSARQLIYENCNLIKKISWIGERGFNKIIENLESITRVQFAKESLPDAVRIVLEDISTHCIGLNDVDFFIYEALDHCKQADNVLSDRKMMEQLYLKSPLKEIMEGYICDLCDMKETTFDEIASKLPLGITNHGIETQIIINLIQSKKLQEIEKEVYLYFPTIWDLAQMLENGKQKTALLYRLQGKSLSEISAKMGVTSERVRQLSVAAINKIPNIREDSFSYWYQNYDIPGEQFMQIFGLSDTSYNYLKIRYKKSDSSVGDILADRNITSRINKNMQHMKNGNMIQSIAARTSDTQ